MSLKGKKALVTGAGGFIGSHLVETLIHNGVNVRAFVHYNSRNDPGLLNKIDETILSSVDLFYGDLKDPVAVQGALEGIDTVFHLGALIGIPYSYVNPYDVVQTNVMGTLNILSGARNMKVSHVVHTSTSEVYGTALYTPIDEKHPMQAQSPYSASKIGADKIAESFYLCFGLPVSIVRPFNTYGPRQSMRAVIPTIIVQALTQDKIKLGALYPRRDFTYVSDTVNGFITAAESESSVGQILNLGVGQDISIGELATHVLKLIDRDLPVISESTRIRPDKSEVKRLLSDNSKAKQVIGWEPKVSLEAGLHHTIEWIKNNLDQFNTSKYTV
jgi:dTDP-glucose 4,6-dehydratase